MEKTIIYCLGGCIVLVVLQVTCASDPTSVDLLTKLNLIPDEDFDVMLNLLTQLLLTNRADMKSLQASIGIIEQTMQELKTRVDNLESATSHLSNAIIQTQEQVASVSSSLVTLQSTAVTNLKLGTSELKATWRDTGFTDEYGYVITSVHNFNSDEYIDNVNRRKIQVQINGMWVDINQG